MSWKTKRTNGSGHSQTRTDITRVHGELGILIRAASISSALANWRVTQAVHAVSSCQEMLCPRAAKPAQRIYFLDSGKM